MTGARSHEFDSDRSLPAPVEELFELVDRRALLGAFIARELKVRYKRTVLGVAWTMLHPVLLLIVLTLVFSRPFGAAAPSYPLFLLPALILWNFFSQTVSRIVAEAAAGADLWRRVRVPRTALPLTAVCSGIVNLAIALVVVIVVCAWVGPVDLPALLTLPVTGLLAACFTFGAALLLAAVALYFPDISDILTLILPALLFATPVIYPRRIVDPRISDVLAWNPLTVFVEAFRQPLYTGTVPASGTFLVMTVIAMASLCAGWLAFTIFSNDAQFRG